MYRFFSPQQQELINNWIYGTWSLGLWGLWGQLLWITTLLSTAGLCELCNPLGRNCDHICLILDSMKGHWTACSLFLSLLLPASGVITSYVLLTTTPNISHNETCVQQSPLGHKSGLYREVVPVQRLKSIAKELLGPNQVVFIERQSLYRGQNQ